MRMSSWDNDDRATNRHRPPLLFLPLLNTIGLGFRRVRADGCYLRDRNVRTDLQQWHSRTKECRVRCASDDLSNIEIEILTNARDRHERFFVGLLFVSEEAPEKIDEPPPSSFLRCNRLISQEHSSRRYRDTCIVAVDRWRAIIDPNDGLAGY